jgi:hypothetical protein
LAHRAATTREWAFLFGFLLDDAKARFIDQDEFYYLGDHMLNFFFKYQGYDPSIDLCCLVI